MKKNSIITKENAFNCLIVFIFYLSSKHTITFSLKKKPKHNYDIIVHEKL